MNYLVPVLQVLFVGVAVTILIVAIRNFQLWRQRKAAARLKKLLDEGMTE